MTEARKPGGHGKIASMLLVFQLETRMVSHEHFTDFLKILPVTPATLKICLKPCLKHSGSY